MKLHNASMKIESVFKKIAFLAKKCKTVTDLLGEVNQKCNSIYKVVNSPIRELREVQFEKNCARFAITNKEKEIITLIEQGFTQKEISEKLYISEYTVNAHIKNIFSKVNVHNSLQMVHKIYTS
jgi:DNA-binding NarL/FixJ family response regulator